MASSSSLNLPLCLKRYVLFTSYIGTRYKGSQRLTQRGSVGKANNDTVQEAIEISLESVLARDKCRLTCGSRTDRGVHSLMNCWTLPLIDYNNRPTDLLKRMSNQKLLKDHHDILINDVILLPAEFHPRKKAVSREYIFRIGVVKSANRKLIISPSKYRLLELFSFFPANEVFRLLPLPCFDLERAEEAANLLRGWHDFATFSFQTKETDDTIRDLEIEIKPANHLTFQQQESALSSQFDVYHFHFRSRAFLYNQVRRMMGAILGYATFNQTNLAGIKKLIDEPDTTSWPINLTIVEPWGLFLSGINYSRAAFQGATRTYEDGTQEEVELDTFPGLVDGGVDTAAVFAAAKDDIKMSDDSSEREQINDKYKHCDSE